MFSMKAKFSLTPCNININFMNPVLGVACVQHIESPSRSWFSRPRLSLQINSYPSSSGCVCTDPIHWPRNPPSTGIDTAPHLVAWVQSTMLLTVWSRSWYYIKHKHVIFLEINIVKYISLINVYYLFLSFYNYRFLPSWTF